MTTADDTTLGAVERWIVVFFVGFGLPTFLTPFSGFCFTVHVLTDATYRKKSLDEVLVELRQAFAGRAVHLATRAGRGA